jgi:eukaryotic-like serine/threonine-protein kinase
VVADGRIYVGAQYDELYYLDNPFVCLDAETGKVLWTFWVPSSPDQSASPAVYDGKVYFETTAGTLYCLDAYNGSQQWSFSVDCSLPFSPTVADGKVYVYAWDRIGGAKQWGLYCLDASTGAKLWFTNAYGLLYGSVVYNDNKLYIKSGVVHDYYDGIECLNATSYAELWQYILPHSGASDGEHFSSLAYSSNKIYVSTDIAGGARITCLDATGNGDGTTTQLWNRTITYNQDISGILVMTPCVAYGNVYAYCGDILYCFNASTGASVYQKTLDETIYYESIAIADGKIYTATYYTPDP